MSSKNSLPWWFSLASALILSAAAPAAAELAPGQIALAAVPELTGDAATDFTAVVLPGETVTAYLIAGPFTDMTIGYGLSIGISEAANLLVEEVRAAGEVFASQNSIGSVIFLQVSFEACRTIDAQTVLAEIDLNRHGSSNTLELTLASAHYDPGAAPEFQNCSNEGVAFDDSASQTLILFGEPVAVEEQTWFAVKALFAR